MASRKQIEQAAKTLLKATVAIDNVMRLPLFVGGGDADLVEAKRLIWLTIEKLDGMTHK